MKLRPKNWTKKEMENRQNWDFTYCSKFPNHLQKVIFQYEITRDKKTLRGEQPSPPFASDENRIISLFYDEVEPEDLNFQGPFLSERDQVIRLVDAPPDSGISGFGWEDDPVVTFSIHPIFLHTSKYDSKLVSEFKKWIKNKRQKTGYFTGKKTKNYYLMLRNIAFFRLKNASLDRQAIPGQECEKIYPLFPRAEYRAPTRLPKKGKKRRKSKEEIWQERSAVIETYLDL
jgi:hypothetical protein